MLRLHALPAIGKCRVVPNTCLRSLHYGRIARHANPLGLPRRPGPPPQIPRKGAGPPKKRPIANVKKVIAVASGKGGVGKSTVAVNLAFALASRRDNERPLNVGLLDLDIFGPSIPGLMGLDNVSEPALSEAGALLPLRNHGIKCMSMGFLLPPLNENMEEEDRAVVWRGLMVQKAVQQLLFDVDWRSQPDNGVPLDVLVVDLPPGTGDVPLTLGQLVEVDGAVIVSTPQNVALYDVRRGIAMFKKLSIPIMGLVLNQSSYYCSHCGEQHHLYGDPSQFAQTAKSLVIDVFGHLPLIPDVSISGNKGVPFLMPASKDGDGNHQPGRRQWQEVMDKTQTHIRRSVLGDC